MGLMANNYVDTGVDKLGLAQGEVEEKGGLLGTLVRIPQRIGEETCQEMKYITLDIRGVGGWVGNSLDLGQDRGAAGGNHLLPGRCTWSTSWSLAPAPH